MNKFLAKFGLIPWIIVSKDGKFRTMVGAKNKVQAWAKFCSNFFRNAPLQPNRADYEIVEAQ